MFNKRNRKPKKEEKFGDIVEKEEMDDVEEYTLVDDDEDDEEEEEVVRKEKTARKGISYYKAKRAINIGFVIIMILLVLVAVDVIAVGRFDKGPFFALPLKEYDDGGSKVYYGLGYKVIKYHQVQGRRDKALGLWTMKYDTDPINVQDIDLAIDIRDNELNTYQNYYRKFVRITSTLRKVNEEKHQLTLGYRDEEGKYDLDIICTMSEDQSDVSSFEEEKEITVIGTIMKYQPNTDTKNRRIYVSDCFAQQ